MEHLTKQQIVLLTLLVSFVTSIATGIVTVSLVNQAPAVTQTINQIVERTIEKVSSDQTASAGTPGATFQDQIAASVDQVSQSLVRIKPAGGDSASVMALGLVVSKSGVIVTDKGALGSFGGSVAVFPDGQEFPIQVVQSQIDGDIVFVLALIQQEKKASENLVPVSFAPSIKLGQTVIALSGKESNTLAQGIISKALGNVATTTLVTTVGTTIPSLNVLIGSPLFSAAGDIIGIRTSSLHDGDTAAFYPSSLLRSTIPDIH